ncbi:MAG: type II toxin-antitoxin system RelE/ParE family toxin [Candidatus Marinimicrobia bacterium]|nr:type II toxin-antitoxin system RelE/ParE family toxin [Candidatus Neomarinimicrobiota bacterium]MBL7031302.1 type II toxin-antitoxin system RelE/ParE family toxin [Candidatus Neomarinimicrobiota bacterium]
MYRIILTRRAKKQIKSLPENVKIKVKGIFIGMKENPFIGDVKKLKVKHNRYRLRFGSYRIIFDLNKKDVTVFILTVRHRKDAYR